MTMKTSALSASLCALLAGCAQHGASTPASTLQGGQGDEAAIYGLFLDGWRDDGTSKLNVAIRADALTPEDIGDMADCAQPASGWTATEPVQDLTGLIGHLPYVRLVNPDKWVPTDPQDLMSRGHPVESAVEDGFAHGLMSLSAIAFDRSRQTAALKYAFVCGGLCGNGSFVIFRKTQDGWFQENRGCGGWISQREARPDPSSRSTPLRGTA